ncbi:MAG: restriction endonuclease [uncultured Rubrobacteraceae bacterium]|uniref:Restriction endonuclease n=1 Tax=uncultured Rubrobacteraceae bacterium TaxID=349277 RepID=A0A6J4Q7F7_9ACTN|nr:MAG: restriction endonuclease [uncultured Rubrobacteraceae bacterium]
MRLWVGVTDNGWFDFLSRADPDEVNFWQPGGRAPFVNLEVGAPFLFKLKRPNNHIAGGGTFVKFSKLPLSLAWEVFKTKNGAGSREDFEAMIRRLLPNSNARDPEIGCTVLTAPFFWRREHWIADPMGWSGNIVRGRYYDTATEDGANLWASVQERIEGLSLSALPDKLFDPGARYGEPTLTRPRLGQGAFRVVVTDAYRRRCAITGESTLPVLEAAHIKPFAKSGTNEVSNGMLLRSDFHKLFDAGLVTVTPDLRVEVSPQIKEQWFNGRPYYRLQGRTLLNVPQNSIDRPSRDFLTWHNENCFQW